MRESLKRWAPQPKRTAAATFAEFGPVAAFTDQSQKLPHFRALDHCCPRATMSVSEGFHAHYRELKAIAHRELMRHQRHSINTTALLHEAWIKLANAEQQTHPRHFRNQVAIAMRHILVDAARRRQTQKRQPLEEIERRAYTDGNPAYDVLQIEALINWLANDQPRMAETVVLRVFASLDLEEIAEHQGVNVRTVRRDWLAATTLLRERAAGD
jgi:RNA polymerase sigma factor (TIGR02999 family)